MTTSIEDLELPDLASPATFHESIPHDAFEMLRSHPGLVWHPAEAGTRTGGFWVVSRYAEVAEILQHPDLYRSGPGPAFPLANLNGDSPMGKHILFMDPPEHSRVRRAAARSFGPRVVAQFENWIRDVVVETLDAALAEREFDWVAEVARYIPARVIASVMGVPREKRDYIVAASEEIFVAQSVDDGGARFAQAFMGVGQFTFELGQEKLRNPQDDMMTVMAQAHDSGEIDLVEYQLYCASLVVAGFETTHTTIGHIARLLATDDRIRSVADSAITEGRTAQLVDEFLRYISPAMTFMRTSSSDHEFRGQPIKENDALMLLFASANRDPAAFENPHEFDPDRTSTAPSPSTGLAGLAFSAGPHRCVGHVLAKLELRILLEEMFSRGVRLELAGEPGRGWSLLVNQLLSLPVRVTMD